MASIMRPDVVWIEGRCYRANEIGSNAAVTELQEHDLYENEAIHHVIDSEEDDNEFDVTEIDESRFSACFHVSKHYIGSIIGKKGAIISRIRQETKTDIKIPKPGQTGDIVIFGSSPSNVKAACRRINMIVMSSRMKQKPTHFISIPMNEPNLMERYEEFKECVLRECADRGVEESIFCPASTLHLTLGVMCLMDNEERLFVSKLLTDAREKVVLPIVQGHMPLRIRIRGVAYMNDDPREINVLYGRVQEEGDASVLQNLADSLFDYFYKSGYMKEQYGDHVKLHMTLMNTRDRHAAVDIEESSQQYRPRETFDGSKILEKFSDYDFGVVNLKDIHLSQMHSFGPDGYYTSTCVISCNV